MKVLKRSAFILMLTLCSALVICLAGCDGDGNGDDDDHDHPPEGGGGQPAAKCGQVHVYRTPHHAEECGNCNRNKGHDGQHLCGTCDQSF